VSHTIEVNAIWGPNNTGGGAPASYYQGQVNGPIVPIVQGYWTSFIRCYDPNTHRLPGTPVWEAWTTDNSYQRLKFETNSTYMEAVPADQQSRCAYLASIGVSLEQ
jgi:carboxylesterase type B